MFILGPYGKPGGDLQFSGVLDLFSKKAFQN